MTATVDPRDATCRQADRPLRYSYVSTSGVAATPMFCGAAYRQATEVARTFRLSHRPRDHIRSWCGGIRSDEFRHAFTRHDDQKAANRAARGPAGST
jgi:hypothetical protein